MSREDKTEETKKSSNFVCWNLNKVNKELNPKKKLKRFLVKFHEEVEKTIYYKAEIEAETEEKAREIFEENPWETDYDETNSYVNESHGAEEDGIEEMD